MKLYIAGPWFTPRQDEILQLIKDTLNTVGIPFYSPKDEFLFEEGKEINAKEVFESNLNAIDSCQGMVVITDGKDIGTMFEAGYAYAMEIPILYIWVDHDDRPMNLMLSQSGESTCLGIDEFEKAMEFTKRYDSFPIEKYVGTQQ